MKRTHAGLLGRCLLLLSAAAGSSVTAGADSTAVPAADRKLMEEFRVRVKAYVDLRQREEDKVPDLRKKAQAGEIEAYEKAMAEAVRAARADARPGDLFFAQVKPVFVRILSSELRGPGKAPARKTAAEGNPDADGTARPAVAVNATYREATLTTMPPGLLQKLPALPDPLEYRLVGRDLVLRDRGAGLIVDFIKDAAPPLPQEKH
jgi:hypothetical protein